MLNTTEDMVHEQLKMLQGRNLIREQEPGKWVRKVLDEKTGKFEVHSSSIKNKKTLMLFLNSITVWMYQYGPV